MEAHPCEGCIGMAPTILQNLAPFASGEKNTIRGKKKIELTNKQKNYKNGKIRRKVYCN